VRHDVARGRPRRPDARHTQCDADEPLRDRSLRVARAGDGTCHRLEAVRQPQRRADAGASGVDAAADGARQGASASNSSSYPRPKREDACRSCARTTLRGPCGFPATARRIPPTSRNRSRRVHGCAARRSSKASRSRASTALQGRVTGIRWRTADDEGAIACEALVNCGGQWARAFGRLAGVNVPALRRRAFLPRHQGDRRRDFRTCR
jgi:glycine/D-amino acid oxidase-like deaminating enzyme